MPDRISLLQSELKQDRSQLESAGISRLKNSENRFIKAKNALDMLSPLKVMGRGFTYVTQEDHASKASMSLASEKRSNCICKTDMQMRQLLKQKRNETNEQ